MKKALKIFYLFLSFNCFSQTLHHQMISSQGGNVVTNSGIVVKYTIGQQSISGTKTGNVIVQQGFQQSNWDTIIAANNVVLVNTTTYPNPFIDSVNFQFSSPVTGPIKVALFDVMGRLVYYKEKVSINNIVTIDNLSFAQGEYFVKLTAKNYTYSTNLLKSK
jgi:hypothetical protein